jgi:ABC-type lipoprotein release transport system permease subunit
MTTWTLIWRSLRFHARAHLGTLLGAAIGSAVLVGALVVGDSVRGSLRDRVSARLGRIQVALSGGDHFFRTQLASDLSHKGLIEGDPVLAAIQLPATANRVDGSTRANQVQLLGVTRSFWRLDAQFSDFQASPTNDEVVLNVPLARQLDAHPGDTVLLRIAKPSAFSRDAPITPVGDASLPLRLKVRAIVPDEQLGLFGLHATQSPPLNAFVSMTMLQEALKLPGKANLILAATDESPTATLEANIALKRTWQLTDAELEVRELPDLNQVELRTSRVFLDPAVPSAVLGGMTNGQGILTYFVNGLRVGTRETPYSMVTAAGTPLIPPGMRDDEIILNQWTADDLQAGPGTTVALSYYTIGLARRLEERTNQFVVRGVVPLAGVTGDQSLMPEFPGLENAESTRDWDSTLPVTINRIRPKDEDYWKKHRGTPKAFVTLAAGQKMWNNRFGNLTGIRWSPPDKTSLANLRTNIQSALRMQLDPRSVGLQFEPVHQNAIHAAEQSQDFGQLFLGFSFFLIGAALLLMALLYQFGIEQRAPEIGTLLALGFQPKQVRRLLLTEGVALSALGAVLGVAGGIAYAKGMLWGLSTIWSSAVGASALRYHAEPLTLAIGAMASTATATLVIWLALRKQARQPARELLVDGGMGESRWEMGDRETGSARALACSGERPRSSLDRVSGTVAETTPDSPERAEGGWRGLQPQRTRSHAVPRKFGVQLWIGCGSTVVALGLVGFAFAKDQTSNAGLFFGAGALLLIGGLAFAATVLRRMLDCGAALPSLGELALRNAARRRKRSVAVIALLACGSFLITSIGAFRLDAEKDATKRGSGTGGFRYLGESSLPIVQDLNTQAGREHFALDAKALDGVGFVQMRVRDGDDASCLNLNRAQRPRLLGVRPEALAEREAFTFAKALQREGSAGASPSQPWLLLNSPQPDGAIPAIGDDASIQWALGKKVGDTLEYTDERGRAFKVRIVGAVANSILQGSLLISEAAFTEKFTSESGYRMFLIDAPSNDTLPPVLTRALQDVGFEMTRTTTRLAAFNAVQNTYLNTFQVLGGLGLLLGSAGLGVVVLRNVLERRGELAVMLAVGFRRRVVRRLVAGEHAALLLAGLGIGVVSALVAVLPALISPRGEFPAGSLALTLGAVLASGMVWTWAAAALALRGRLLDALRSE